MAIQNFGSAPGRNAAVSAKAPGSTPKVMGLIQSAMKPAKAAKPKATKTKKGI